MSDDGYTRGESLTSTERVKAALVLLIAEIGERRDDASIEHTNAAAGGKPARQLLSTAVMYAQAHTTLEVLLELDDPFPNLAVLLSAGERKRKHRSAQEAAQEAVADLYFHEKAPKEPEGYIPRKGKG